MSEIVVLPSADVRVTDWPMPPKFLSGSIRSAELFQAIEELFAGDAIEAETSRCVGAPSDDEFDLAEALDRVENDREFLATLVDVFLDSLPGYMTALRGSIDRNDPADVEREAHTIKGAALNFDAFPTADAARRLEQMGRSGDLAGAEEVYATLAAAVDRLTSALGAIKVGCEA